MNKEMNKLIREFIIKVVFNDDLSVQGRWISRAQLEEEMNRVGL